MVAPKRDIEAVFFDLGDTLMKEATEIKDADGVTLQAELLPDAIDVLRTLRGQGHRLALVADTRIGTYRNVLSQHGVFGLFDAFAISDELGCAKPDERMFEKALDDLGIDSNHKHRVVMVGNNLKRDIAGAKRAGLVAVHMHWNDNYPSTPCCDDEAPDFTIHTLSEFLPLAGTITEAINGRAKPLDVDTARRYAPTLLFDQLEPFLPVLVGCTIVDQPSPSPSFPRVLRPPKGGFIIEYAIYWDWDIGHLYELEHLWTHANADGSVAVLEGSWHGALRRLSPPASERAPEVVLSAYSQPGKHAFAPDPEWFAPRERFAQDCQGKAGNAGMIVTPPFKDVLRTSPEVDALARAYLQKHAFTPTWEFTKEFPLASSDVRLVAWPVLFEAIPRRIGAWIDALRGGQQFPT